jgi:hypothetical protein
MTIKINKYKAANNASTKQEQETQGDGQCQFLKFALQAIEFS